MPIPIFDVEGERPAPRPALRVSRVVTSSKVPSQAPENISSNMFVPVRGSAPVNVQQSSPADPCWSASADIAIVAILETPAAGETTASAFARKECELRRLFASFTTNEARALCLRLSIARAGDPVSEAFKRMTAERRGRLIAFLEDARRREALGRGGRHV